VEPHGHAEGHLGQGGAAAARLKLLWVATKSPWPAIDGGRVLLAQTLTALAAQGADVTLVAPVSTAIAPPSSPPATLHLVACPPRHRATVALRGLVGDVPLTVRGHMQPAVRARVAALLDAEPYDAVVAEQLQALPQCAPARARGVPLVLRAENVESDLWWARPARPPIAAPVLRLEADRLAAFEGAAVRSAALTLALTTPDAERLAHLGGPGARVTCVPAPFAADDLAPAPALPGAPAVVLFGSGGWFPNLEAGRWFVSEVWPVVRARLPAAVLHVVGPCDALAAGMVRHAAPADSASAFPAGAVMVVPLRTASGVRMKILEAWARGVPVVATPAAASGLEARHGEELLLAMTPGEFAEAIAAAPAQAERLVARGRALLAARHRPEVVAGALLDALRTVGAAAAR
jgi:hypothetical protein